MRMIPIIRAVLLAALLFGCEEQPEKPPAADTTPETSPEQAPSAKVMGVEITLGEHATPALKELVAKCHVPSPEELAIISVLAREPRPVEDAAPLLGVTLPEDDFARGKAKKELEEKLAALEKELGAKILCARFEVGIERYDFDRQRFLLAGENALAIIPDLTGNAATQKERLSLERGVELGDTPWPASIAVIFSFTDVASSKKDAERVNDALHPAITAEKEAPEPTKKKANARGNDPLTTFTRLAQKGEYESLVAFIEAGDNNNSKRPREDRKNRDEGARNNATKAYQAKLEEVFAIGKDKRRADVYAFFSLAQTRASVQKFDGFDGGALSMLAINPFHVVFTDINGVAFATKSPSPAPFAATHKDMSHAVVDDAIAASCRGRIKRRRATVMKDGELVDRVTQTCSRCPSSSSDPEEDARITRVLEGSFLMPGSADTLVLFDGCEPMAYMGGGALLMTRSLAGKYQVVRWLPGLVDDCQVVHAEGTTDKIVCRSHGMSGGFVDGAITAFELTPSGEPVRTPLAPISDSRGSCREGEHQVANPREVTVDGARVTIAYEAGEAIYSGDCDLEEEKLSQLEVTFTLDATSGKFEVSETSKDALAKVEALAGGGDR